MAFTYRKRNYVNSIGNIMSLVNSKRKKLNPMVLQEHVSIANYGVVRRWCHEDSQHRHLYLLQMNDEYAEIELVIS